MKSFRVLIILILLGIAAPLLIHYRAWSLGISVATPPVVQAPAQSSEQGSNTIQSQGTAAQPVATAAQTLAVNSELADPSFDLPGASSSLPLLSVIGFGVFLGGLISALRTRPAHK